ncbi:MAG: CHRD domain-containing protein [Chloroflexi bacterium]|nr:MAG: CHRD domain-containing protein [Chloroflexota bacterium]TMB74389.1 MAG: CHRD domain-containing protein [Chloroflexota bacterium]TMC28206.1 MAG: CHRD domain-containing protein [Chloroflexota bacterium]TMC33011.1 MAG: CHRD domain-containing protein [Chloroflexota bacterium]TMC58340.1 MAG: CHRD domain-containing protein [Chloroflexota bacterium]
MRTIAIAFSGALLAFAGMGATARADQPAPSTFVAVLSTDEETGACAGISNSARGLAVFHVTDEATGTVSYRIVANNLPGTTSLAHIHIGPPGVAGPAVQPLAGVAGNEQGVIATGSFTNPLLLAALRANTSAYYVNVHTVPNCPNGVIRGQLGDHGP